MKKYINFSIMVIFLLLMLVLTGCETKFNKTVTFKVDTGDKISIRVDSNDNWKMDKEIPFNVFKNEEKISTGKFITKDEYNTFVNSLQSPLITIMDEGSRHGTEYIFYESVNITTGEKQYNYLIIINGSNTGILLENSKSKELAEECFKTLTFVNEK